MALKHIIQVARPTHWVKNIIVLLPVVFAMKMDDASAWAEAFLAAAAFCLLAGGVYIVNDIVDRKRDLLYPVKRDRPIVACKISVGSALIEAIVLIVAGMLLATRVGWLVLYLGGAYVLLQLAYTFALKRRIIIDVICIALGFVLRAMAGAVAIRVEISPWLVICTFTICLFIGFCKRCNEAAVLAGQLSHRDTLAAYSENLLTHLITLSAAIAVISFLLYASSARTVGHLGTIYLVYTLPLVVYGVFRFAMMSMSGRFTDPISIALHDWPLQVTALAWLAVAMAIIRWGQQLQAWLGTLQ